MNRDMTKIFLPIFYGFCLVLLVGAIILMYNMDTDQKNRLLQIQKNLDIESTGEIVKLELNDANKKGEVTYHVEDPSIVTVNKDGSLVSLREGSTKVTVTTKDNTKSQTIVVNVGKEAIKEYKENNKKEEQDKNQSSTENKKPNSSQKPPQNIEQTPPSQDPEIPDEVPIEIVATKITLNQNNITLYIGDELKLTATIEPEDTANKKVTWSSSNTNIATVSSNGNVKALSEGTATITVKTSNNITATCNITVKKTTSNTQTNIKVENVYLSHTNTTVNVDSSITLTATISPTNATNKNITWTSSNTSIATVSSDGKVVGKKEGTVTITAKSSNGKIATCKVTVNPKPIAVTSIKLSKTSATITASSNITLTATISPSNATNQKITWTSSNTSIATVSSAGKVTGKTAGTVTITAKSSNGKTATCKVTVNPKPIEVTKVSLDKTTATIDVGKTVKLTATVSPTDAANKTITWTSSNTNIATVNNYGKIKGIKPGVVTITAKSANGKTATAKIIVNKTPTNANELCEHIERNETKQVLYEDFKKIINKTDDYYAIKEAHNCANKLNLPVLAKENGTYNIYNKEKESSIIVKTNTNLNNATIYIHDEKGIVATGNEKVTQIPIFTIDSNNNEINLNSAKISTLKGTITKNKKQISQLSGYGNALVVVENNTKKHFIRLKGDGSVDSGQNQTDIFKINNNGNILNDIIWDFDNITKVTIYSIPSNKLQFKNGNFITIADTTTTNPKNGYTNRGIKVNRSNTEITGINHTVVDSNKAKIFSIKYSYGAFLQITNCSDITIKNSTLYALQSLIDGKSSSTYDLTLNKVINSTINNVKIPEEQMLEDRWGVTGTNYTKNITFSNCRLNRIDSHKAAHDLTIQNSTIGAKGLTLIGSGDLTISGTTVKGIDNFITLRRDYGSRWDGKISITDSTLIPQNTTNISLIKISVPFTNSTIHNFGYDLILPNVNVQNLTIKGNVSNFSIFDNRDTGLLNGNLNNANNYTNGKFKYILPTTIKYSNITSNNGTIPVSKYITTF